MRLTINYSKISAYNDLTVSLSGNGGCCRVPFDPANERSVHRTIAAKYEHVFALCISNSINIAAANDIAIAGVEFIVDGNGRPFTYDVNTNTNYNPDAEAKDGRAGSSRSGMGAIATHLGSLLMREANAVPGIVPAAIPA